MTSHRTTHSAAGRARTSDLAAAMDGAGRAGGGEALAVSDLGKLLAGQTARCVAHCALPDGRFAQVHIAVDGIEDSGVQGIRPSLGLVDGTFVVSLNLSDPDARISEIFVFRGPSQRPGCVLHTDARRQGKGWCVSLRPAKALKGEDFSGHLTLGMVARGGTISYFDIDLALRVGAQRNSAC